ncbi:MAG: TonB-dependent receptor [Pseudomonadota bacterium]
MNALPRRHVLGLSLLSATLGSTAAVAESAQPAAGGIEEIVVSARYKAESLQDSPMAVSAFDNVKLESLVALDLEAVGPSSPNVHIQEVSQFSNSAAISIRGMGTQDIESTNETRVGVSVNGVFLSRPVASMIDLFDVERIEVLRGPQGTTFGKNSLAGGINVTTIRPDGTFDYNTEVTAGNYGRADFRGAIQAPLGDQLSGRLSVLMQNYDGHNENRVNGEDLNGQDTDTVRGTLVWTPTDSLEATLITHWTESENDAPGGIGDSDPDQLLGLFFSEPDDGSYTVGRDTPAFHDTDQWSATAIVDWDMSTTWSLTSVTGYQSTDDWIANDFDNTEVQMFSTFRDQVHDQFSQELRLHSNFLGLDDWRRDLELVLGLYYFEQEHELVQAYLVDPFVAPQQRYADYTTQDNDSRAAFAQAIYALTNDLNVTFGVRHTRENKEFERNPFVPVPGLDVQNPDATVPSIGEMADYPRPLVGDLDSENTSFELGLDYHFNDNVMGYASFSQGFKAGEFGARATSEFAYGPTEDEEADSYELGIKSEWLDGRLRANVTAFHTNYENLQFTVFIPSASTTQESAIDNIGESTNQGVELELTAMPVTGLTLEANVGYLDAEYDEFCASIEGPVTTTNPVSDCGDVQALGNGQYIIETDNTEYDLARSPEWQAYLAAEYEIFTDVGSFFARASGEYEDNYYLGAIDNPPKARTGDHWLFDGSIGWRSLDEKWRVQAWCKNCADKEYVNGFVPTASLFNQKFYNTPRTYGLTLGYRH